MSDDLMIRLISVPRFTSFIVRRRGAVERLFTAEELAYCTRYKKGVEERLAVRFAAKCAARSKIKGLGWHDVYVTNDALGAPNLSLRQHPNARSAISLTHDGNWAIAAVVIEGDVRA